VVSMDRRARSNGATVLPSRPAAFRPVGRQSVSVGPHRGLRRAADRRDLRRSWERHRAQARVHRQCSCPSTAATLHNPQHRPADGARALKWIGACAHVDWWLSRHTASVWAKRLWVSPQQPEIGNRSDQAVAWPVHPGAQLEPVATSTCSRSQPAPKAKPLTPWPDLARPPWPDHPGPTLARPWLDLGSTLAQGFGTSAMDKRVGSGESSAPPHAGRDAATPERACHRGDPPASVQRAHPAEGLGVNLAKRLYLTHPAGAPAMNCAHHEHFVDLKKDRPISPGPISPGPISPGPISSGPISSGPISSGPISSGLGTVRPVITSGRFRSTKSQRRAYCNSSCIRPSLVFSMPCCSRKGAAVTNRRRARSPEAR